jgi:hypothetical protein
MLGRVVPRGPPGRRRADHRGFAKEIANKSERIAHAGTISPFAPDGKPPSGGRWVARALRRSSRPASPLRVDADRIQAPLQDVIVAPPGEVSVRAALGGEPASAVVLRLGHHADDRVGVERVVPAEVVEGPPGLGRELAVPGDSFG